MYRLKKQSRQNWPYYLNNDYLGYVLPNGWQFMSKFFVLEKVNDPSQFSRIVTLEYLFQKLNVKF